MIGFSKPSPYQLAMHWTQGQLYLLLARQRRSSLTLELLAARMVDGIDTSSAEALGRPVAELLNEFQVTRPRTWVALSRSQIDVFHVDLPAATDHELVSLVQLYMLQNEPDLVESATLDFVRVQGGSDQSRILAYAAQRATLEFVDDVVNGFGGDLVKVGVRGLASFGLLPPESGNSVVVIPYDSEADLVFGDSQGLTTLRSIRLPKRGDPRYFSELSAELRRSLLITQPQDQAEDAIQIVLMAEDAQSEWVHELRRDLLLPVVTVDPCVDMVAEDRPEHVSPFAPLLGMLACQRAEVQVDFQNPRQEVVRRLPLRKIAIYVVAALLLFGLVGHQMWQRRQSASEEVAMLQNEVSNLQKMADKLAKSRAVAQAVAGWDNDNIVWLDELRDLSRRFPTASEAYVQRINMAAGGASGNKVVFQVRATDPAVIHRMESLLRDPHHAIESKRVSEATSSGEEYPWHFEAVVRVAARSIEEYREALKPVVTDADKAQLATATDPTNAGATQYSAEKVVD